MTFDQGTISAALAGIVAVLAVWVAFLQRSMLLQRRRVRRLLAGGEAAGIDEVLERGALRVDEVARGLELLEARQRDLAAVAQRSVQRIGMVRFNPFADTGGDQSFAIALLDGDGNGVVLSSLHSRSDTRIFAKPVAAGRSSHPLSDEEQAAIRQALAPAR